MADTELIEHLGGPTKVAELLKFDKQGGVQRVQNWLVRGIPAQIKVDYPELFMRGLAPNSYNDKRDPDRLSSRKGEHEILLAAKTAGAI